MTPFPVEATFFAQTYRSAASTGDVPAATAGVGLYGVDPPSRSLFHRLTFDESWHFYAGDPVRLVLPDADGSDEEVILGDPTAGHSVQHVVPAKKGSRGRATGASCAEQVPLQCHLP
jgi:predicted cupin superfamily sugar epimerase